VDIKEMDWKDLDWINLAQNMDEWRNILKMVMNFLGCMKCGEFLEIKYCIIAQEGICCMDLV
jgi:hypothetical protein